MTTPASPAALAALLQEAQRFVDSEGTEWHGVPVLTGAGKLVSRLIAALQAARAVLDPSEAARNAAIAKVVEGFSAGVFVRATGDDVNPGWAIKLMPYLNALAELQRVAGDSGAPHPEPGTVAGHSPLCNLFMHGAQFHAEYVLTANRDGGVV